MAASPQTPNPPAALNRGLLTVFGLIALLGGAYVLLRGLGLLGQNTVGQLGLPVQDQQAPLVSAGATVQGWVPYLVIVVAVVIGLLCLRWMLAQTRRRAVGQTWRFTGDRDKGTTSLDTAAAASAFTAEVQSYTGVHSASAVITGGRTDPELHLTLTLEDQTPVTELRARIANHALPRLRAALELDDLPTESLVRLGTATPSSRSR